MSCQKKMENMDSAMTKQSGRLRKKRKGEWIDEEREFLEELGQAEKNSEKYRWFYYAFPGYMKEVFRHNLESGTSNLRRENFRQHIQCMCQQLGLVFTDECQATSIMDETLLSLLPPGAVLSSMIILLCRMCASHTPERQLPIKLCGCVSCLSCCSMCPFVTPS